MVTTEELDMRLYQGFSYISIGVVALVAVGLPVLAATELRVIRINATPSGVELVFATQGNNRPPILTTSRDNSIIVELAETQLRLPASPEDPLAERTSFRKDNPAPGIASVLLSQLNPRTVRVIVSGSRNEPIEQVVRQDGSSLVLSFNRTASRSTPRETTAEVAQRGERSNEATPSSKDSPATPVLSTRPSSADQPPTPSAPPQPQTASQPPRVSQTPAAQPALPQVPGASQQPSSGPPGLPRAAAPPVGDIAVATVDITPRADEEPGRIILRTLRLNQLRATSQVTLAQRLTSRAETGGTVGGRAPTSSFDEFGDSGSFDSGGSTTAQTAIGRTTSTSQTIRYQGAKEILQAFGANTGETSTTADQTFEDEAATDETFEDEATTDETFEDEAATDETFEDEASIDEPFSDSARSSATLLRGLEVVAEARTNTVTLIGPPRLVEIGSAILSQFDVRRRQVAINVKIVDVDLSRGRNSNADLQYRATNSLGIGFRRDPDGSNNFGLLGTIGNVDLPGSSAITRLPQTLLGILFTSIQNQTAKILTNPTLVVQEGSSAQVNLTQEIFSGFETTDVFDDNANRLRRTPIIRPAGVIVNVTVESIDDNGFVNLSVSPEVSAPSGNYETDDGGSGTLLAQRRLETGSVRLRDGQTLILTGIIQDQDRVSVSKIPILGDIPLLGRLFRREERVNERREVVVAVTPEILDDSDQSTAGYRYRPTPESQRLLQP